MYNLDTRYLLAFVLSLPATIVLACDADVDSHDDQLLLDADVVEQPSPRSYMATGIYHVFNGEGFPATMYLDGDNERAWLDIQISAEYSSWAIFDWSTAQPAGYIGNDHQCYSLSLSPGAFPTEAQLIAAQAAGERRELAARERGRMAGQERTLDVSRMPTGLSTAEDILVMNDDESVVLFEIDSVEASAYVPAPSFDRSSCRPIGELLGGTGASADEIEAPAAQPETTRAKWWSHLDRNYHYTFHGAGYWWLSYVGSVFEQDAGAYASAVQSCVADGPGVCKPEWEVGGLFGRYGRYCGDGWGTGSGAPVSSADYCCQLHDGQSWDRSGSFGHEARNLCGFAACLTCKSYLSMSDWETSFGGDYRASLPISAFVSAGIAAAWCWPESYVTGFTCN